jgi:hypothetical protein
LIQRRLSADRIRIAKNIYKFEGAPTLVYGAPATEGPTYGTSNPL